MFKIAKTYWVFTQVAYDRWEEIKREKYADQNLPPRLPGQPVREQCCITDEMVPLGWFEKGYVIDASDYTEKPAR